MRPTTVAIAGSGLAELTCAWLLAARGHRVRLRPRPAGGPRPLLLGDDTLALLHALWGTEAADGPAADSHRLTHRHARWTPDRDADPPLPQPAAVVDGARLARRLLARLADRYPDAVSEEPDPAGPPDPQARPDARVPPVPPDPTVPQWTVTATPPGRSGAYRTAGRRHLLAGEAPCAAGQDDTTARLERTDDAWLHLTPLGDGNALLQAMVPGPVGHPARHLGRLLAHSPLAARLAQAPATAVALPAAPRLHRAPATPPAGRTPGLLLVGAGAIRYDPLSGTGTAQALRTAVLAAAVIDSAAAGTPADRLCAHYTARLRTAFRDHLATCARLYPQAFPTPAWQHELDACRSG
ncbi:NAD(P)/FAD-dependent oxidoreductase [Streptomyces sp. NBC_00555]|uniref:NAD(P)-binding protein n=1 Tax=Streptomyces sp. NBC_00555 TaxID=2903662 RepID=UPI00224E55F7|nr:FAD/NAD(P)-binding protein [Streptomyces sp. NBC_00555]MCX5009691.1 NAD(P)/FAD-dependent oxidoreductase [Streptomyces sp. NBC_00555]